MASFDGQNTDYENAQAVPAVSRPGDDLRKSELGGAQEIANRDQRGQQSLSGSGADCVEASIK